MLLGSKEYSILHYHSLMLSVLRTTDIIHAVFCYSIGQNEVFD